MKYRIFHLLPLVVILAACGNSKERQITETIERFSTAIADEDMAAIDDIAPVIGDAADTVIAELVRTLKRFSEWKVLSIQFDDDDAVASVELRASDRKVNFQVPLKYENGRWTIAEMLRVSQTIDVIPAR